MKRGNLGRAQPPCPGSRGPCHGGVAMDVDAAGRVVKIVVADSDEVLRLRLPPGAGLGWLHKTLQARFAAPVEVAHLTYVDDEGCRLVCACSPCA